MPESGIKCFYDPDKLEKILYNLLSNAIKYTPEGGEILFLVDYTSAKINLTKYDKLEITVKDSGIGIPADKVDKIFERFYQSETNGESYIGSSGIGLSFTKDLLDLLHGTISVKSNPDTGSTFKVVIPLGYKHLKESEYILKEQKTWVKEPGESETVKKLIEEDLTDDVLEKEETPRVLVVEDNAEVRNFIVEIVKEHYQVYAAIDGSAGLKIAQKELPDLIITDLMMPRMGGNELCEKIKTDERTNHIPVIMLTAKSSLDNKLEGYGYGADEYIVKPFHTKELMARVSNLLLQRKKLREKYGNEILLQPGNLKITSVDEQFLNRAIKTIEDHMDDELFNTSALGKELSMSHSTLFRKIQYLTNMSPTKFIQMIRLKRAAELLKNQFGNVSEIAFEVGFSNPSYFAKCFKKSYGLTPFEFQKQNENKSSKLSV